MHCSQVQERLSAWYDGEVRPEERELFASHIETCEACAAVAGDLEKLSALAKSFPIPDPPPELWAGLEHKLDGVPATVGHDEAAGSPEGTRPRRASVVVQLVSLAALLLLAVGTGLWTHRLKNEQASRQRPPKLAVDLDRYLDEFERNPREALSVLIARYQGEAVDPEQAARSVRFHSIAPDRLPEGFSLDGTYLLKMECCTGVQTVYKRKGSEVLAILQHTTDQPVWFGDRPVLVAQVHGRPTRIAQLDGRLAATWEEDGSYVSLVGIQDMHELVRLTASFNQHRQGR